MGTFYETVEKLLKHPYAGKVLGASTPRWTYPIIGAAALAPIVGSVLSKKPQEEMAEVKTAAAQAVVRAILFKQAAGPGGAPPPPGPPPGSGEPPSQVQPSPFLPPSQNPTPAQLPPGVRQQLEAKVFKPEPAAVIGGLSNIHKTIEKARNNDVIAKRQQSGLN